MDSAEVEAVEREIKAEDLTRTPVPSDDEEEVGEERKKTSIFTYLKFVLALVNSAIVSLTTHFNTYSRDYRYIRKVLTAEKKVLKVCNVFLISVFSVRSLVTNCVSYSQLKPDFRTGTRLGISQIWQPIAKTQQA